MSGDAILFPLKGNCFIGNDEVGIRESLLDLRSKVNYIVAKQLT